ncbi:3-hydroxyisobutyrate dehydrogenase [Hwanghaeella grinnelliae]|uniref:3-hydroxyisobutyrate dehydrogenase n=1 Tax=Hwanghaeella grinnelliae TaxID=2500179 RepID=A0A437QZ73_9PROT|nr:3-hydroxyisobutyrate dehydrogenase [Hwanghaeella grinnelliae]RVU39809.1 3-hydroxyisobutyrate dehydrogenase [Hwanghaeella grinnelliae]
MSVVGFIGVGNMGGPMAANLIKAGMTVKAFDLSQEAVDKAVEDGATAVGSAAEAVLDADVVITMLPAGKHVRAVYEGEVIGHAKEGALFIDCSTIDVETTRDVNKAAAEKGFDMVDAPVSGGIMGAAAGTLTFMCGGTDAAFARAKPFLEVMGKTIVHAGGAGNGQAAKICNNMMLGIQMVSVCEAFNLAEKLGLDAQKLFDVSSTASGQCWSMTTYCPVPGPVPTSPANRDYAPGFTAAMMLKDMNLSQDAATAFGAETPLGARAAALYDQFCAEGSADVDFSGIIKMLKG